MHKSKTLTLKISINQWHAEQRLQSSLKSLTKTENCLINDKQIWISSISLWCKNKRLQCIDCGSLFCWYSEKEFNSQMAEFQRHLVNKHNRVKTEIERDVLIELKYEGIRLEKRWCNYHQLLSLWSYVSRNKKS